MLKIGFTTAIVNIADPDDPSWTVTTPLLIVELDVKSTMVFPAIMYLADTKV